MKLLCWKCNWSFQEQKRSFIMLFKSIKHIQIDGYWTLDFSTSPMWSVCVGNANALLSFSNLPFHTCPPDITIKVTASVNHLTLIVSLSVKTAAICQRMTYTTLTLLNTLFILICLSLSPLPACHSLLFLLSLPLGTKSVSWEVSCKKNNNNQNKAISWNM